MPRKRDSEEMRKLKLHARNVTSNLTAAGETCEICGASSYMQKHHTDYTKPLEVQALCITCHGKQHHGNHRKPSADRVKLVKVYAGDHPKLAELRRRLTSERGEQASFADVVRWMISVVERLDGLMEDAQDD